MDLDPLDMDIAPNPRTGSLTVARALLQPPAMVVASPWPALGSAFLAACMALVAAACVILCGPTLGEPSKAVHPPVSHSGAR